ncbi:IclR family transcriptional regulator [Alicycliphilus sp. T452]
MSSSPSTSGTQSIDRAAAMLRRIAARHEHGVALRELVEGMGLDRTTAWRIASSLERQGLVARDARTRLYHLGIEALALGAAGMVRSPLVDLCRPAMKAMARLTDESVFLVLRSGDHSHCVHLEESGRPVRSFALNVGATRLMGLGVASIALLATLDAHELAEHFQRNEAEYRMHEVGLAKLQRWVAQTRSVGFSHVTATGMAGVGLQFRMGSCGNAAVSIVAPRARLPRTRVGEIIQVMQGQMARVLPQLAVPMP